MSGQIEKVEDLKLFAGKARNRLLLDSGDSRSDPTAVRKSRGGEGE